MATKKQLKVFYTILSLRGLAEMKAQIVSSHSDGRTEHASELSSGEMKVLIDKMQLNPTLRFNSIQEAENRMRRRILSLCYTLGWTILDRQKGKHIVDFARLDGWLSKYGFLHKTRLNDYTYKELTTLVTQFENFVKTELK